LLKLIGDRKVKCWKVQVDFVPIFLWNYYYFFKVPENQQVSFPVNFSHSLCWSKVKVKIGIKSTILHLESFLKEFKFFKKVKFIKKEFFNVVRYGTSDDIKLNFFIIFSQF
jgi:hypothetical protein